MYFQLIFQHIIQIAQVVCTFVFSKKFERQNFTFGKG
jgi:hypothetical protein